MDGQLDSVVNELAMAQWDTVTLTIATANLPTIVVGGELSVNFFDVTLTNSTTSENIKFKTPCPVNTILTIDCEKREAYLADGAPVKVSLSVDRASWLDLDPGSNTLVFTDVGTVAVTGVVNHRDKVL